MSLTSSLRWSLYDRALALVPFLLGFAIVAAGVWLGAGAFLDELAFGDPSDAGSPASPVLVGVGVVLGLVVWQVGRSAVRHHAMNRAIEQRIGELVDEEGIASTAASKVDDRIADVETDVQQVSRKTTRLEQQYRGDELGSDEFDTERTGAGGADPADAAAAASGTGATGAGDDAGSGGNEDIDGAADLGDEGVDATGEDAGAPSASDDAAAEDESSGVDGGTDAGDEAAPGGDGGDEADGDDDGDGGSTDEADGFEWEDDDDEEYYRDS